MIIDAFTGEQEEKELQCGKAKDGSIVKGPICSYCGNNKWKINLAKRAQYCTNTKQCGRSIPLQSENGGERPTVVCEELQLEEVRNE